MKIQSIILLIAILLSLDVVYGEVFVYDISSIGGVNTPLQNDGWDGDDIDNWIVQNSVTTLYARNNNDGDDQIVRPNDINFSYIIPETTIALSLEILARNNNNLWEAQLSNGDTEILGIGGDLNNNNKYFIKDLGTEIIEDGTNVTGDQFVTLRLDLDLVTSSANLFFDENLIISNANMNVSAADLAGANSLMIHTTSKFVGPAQFKITTTEAVPEPSTYILIGILAVGSFLSRRKKMKFDRSK